MNFIAIFPGSFKPPHIGHLRVIKELLKNKNIKKIFIIISKKARTIDNNLNKLFNKPITILRNLAEKYLKKKINEKKDIINQLKILIESKKIAKITQEDSYKIWNIYISLLPKYKQNKIEILKSTAKSPVQNGQVISIGKKYIKEGYKILFIKSKKDEGNSRFGFYELTIGKKNIKYFTLPHFKELNSTNMRDCIFNNDKECIKYFIPKKNKIKINKILFKK